MQEFEQDIIKCLDVLHAGGLILYPTDTIWGIGSDATNADAVQKVYALKQRDESKSLVMLVADEKMLLKYVTAPDLQIFDFLKQRPKPTTVIYNGAVGLAPNAIAEDGSVGIRIVQDEFCRHLIKRFRKPIVSTSANISGMPTAPNFSQVDERIKKGVDYIVRHRQNDETSAAASSIIKWKNGVVEIIRD